MFRYADDFVALFEYKSDADCSYRESPERLGKFNLSLSMEKTQILSFSRFPESAGTSFD
jgi:hypothetical protein